MMVVQVMNIRPSSSMIPTSGSSLLGPCITTATLANFQMMPSCPLVILWEHTLDPLAKCFRPTSSLSFCCPSQPPSRAIFFVNVMCAPKYIVSGDVYDSAFYKGPPQCTLKLLPDSAMFSHLPEICIVYLSRDRC